MKLFWRNKISILLSLLAKQNMDNLWVATVYYREG